MSSRVVTLLSKFLRKLAMAVLIAALAWLAYGLWLFSRDQAEYSAHRAGLIAALDLDRARVGAELAEAARRESAFTTGLDAQQKRATQIDKLLVGLHESDAGAWDRVFGDRDELKTHEARVARLEALKTETAAKSAELQQGITQAGADKADRQRQLTALDDEKTTLAYEQHPAQHYLRRAWQRGHWVIYAVFFVYLFGGFLLSLVLYYGWARWVARGRPLHLSPDAGLSPEIKGSAVSLEDALWPGEILWVRQRFVQPDADGLTRRTRLLFCWRAPVSSLFSGLCGLVELRNIRSVGGRRVVFTSRQNPHAELSLIAVSEGGALVLRPSLLIGAITTVASPLVLRTHWRLFHWHSWVTGQFRFFEFAGPCRLVVSGVRALQAEYLAPSEDPAGDSRQTFQAEVVAFTPGLACQPARSRSFWRYARGRAHLFDAKFSGSGVFLARQHLERHGNGLWSAGLKLFGL